MKKKIAIAAAAIMLAMQALCFTACGTNDAPALPVYKVTTSATAGGTLVADKTSAAEGESVTFTVTEEPDYVFTGLTINGGAVETSDNTFTVPGVLCDLAAAATFVPADVTVTFSTGGPEIADGKAVYGRPIGTLPSPVIAGKRFLGWQDADGNPVNALTTVTASGTLALTAVWTDVTDAEKAALTPFSATTVYHDAAATKYGVVFHTETEPIAPQVQVAEGGTDDFSGARVVSCTYETWLSEYIVSAVIDGLTYETEYSVRFGDAAADVWSKTYTFTTRAETVADASFYFVTDTQQTYRNANMGDDAIGDTYYSQVMTDATTRFPDADFIAHGGDIVNYGAEAGYWREMLDSVDEYLFRYPTMVTSGNHEGAGYVAGKETVNKLFNVDYPDGMEPLEAGVYYSFDYGPIHFVSLRSNDALYNANRYTETQLNWLRADLAAAADGPTRWTIVLMHEGILTPDFTAPGSNYHEQTTMPQLLPVFDQYDVDLVLYGHSHYCSSSYPMVWDENSVTTAAGITRTGIRLLTTETAAVEYDGVSVDTFTYPAGTADKGTVLHLTGTAGPQYNTYYNLADLQQNRENYLYYRFMTAGGKGSIDADNAYSMYSYVEVSEDALVLRTYGVNVVANAASFSLDNGRYLDGFMLTK